MLCFAAGWASGGGGRGCGQLRSAHLILSAAATVVRQLERRCCIPRVHRLLLLHLKNHCILRLMAPQSEAAWGSCKPATRRLPAPCERWGMAGPDMLGTRAIICFVWVWCFCTTGLPEGISLCPERVLQRNYSLPLTPLQQPPATRQSARGLASQ